MTLFKPFHVLTGSGTQEIGALPTSTVHVSGYDGTASVTIGFIGPDEIFHTMISGSEQTAPFDQVVTLGKGMRLALKHTGDVTISISETKKSFRDTEVTVVGLIPTTLLIGTTNMGIYG